MSRSRWLAFGLLTPLLTGFDLWSKKAAVSALASQPVLSIHDPWLSFVHAENPGAAFSSPMPLPLIAVAGAVGLVMVVQWLRSVQVHTRWAVLCAALVTGGALGNLLDRIGDGTVTDFIRISAADTAWGPWLTSQVGTDTWPIFNLADVWLIVGVVGIMVLHREPDEAGTAPHQPAQ